MGQVGDLVLSRNVGKQSVILSGGGANGAYEVGVLRALMSGAAPTSPDVPLDPAVLSGTSIGAYSAAVLVSQLEVNSNPADVIRHLEQIWLELIPRDGNSGHNHMFRLRGNPLEYVNATLAQGNPFQAACLLANDLGYLTADTVRRSTLFAEASGSVLERTLQTIDLSTVITREPFERLMMRTISFDNIAKSPRALIVAASNWRTGATRLFTNRPSHGEPIGMLSVLASTSIPGFFPPVEIDGEPYVDGGLTLNTPLEPAVHVEKSDTAHVIYVDPYLPDMPVAKIPTTLDTMDRFISVVFANSMYNEVQTARRINEGLRIVQRAERGERLTSDDAMPFILAADQIADSIQGVTLPVSLKTIHRYRPTQDLGGAMDLLDFSKERIQALIELGYRDAMEHDCRRSRCVLAAT